VVMNGAAKPVSSRLEMAGNLRTKESYAPDLRRSAIVQEEPFWGDGAPDTAFRPLPLSLELNLGGLSTLRHHVENLLSLWCSALDANDSGLLSELLGGASLYVDGAPMSPAEPDLTVLLRRCPPEAGKSSRMYTNLRIWRDSGFGYYSCIVQTWTRGPEWTCADFSSYEGRLRAGPQVWRWDQHRVTTVGKRMEGTL
jgi:hypothetical protein